MKTATEAMVQRELEPYVLKDNLISYINSEVVKEITVNLLSNYSNIYCGNTVDKNGNQIFTVNSTGNNKKYIEIIIK